MPTKQLPLLSNQGVYQFNDSNDGLADYPFFFNGYFEDTGNNTSEVRKFSFVKRPGLTNVVNSGFTASHKILGMCSSADKTKVCIFTAQPAGASRTWKLLSDVLTDKGAPPAAAGAWTTTLGVNIINLESVTFGGYEWAATDLTKGAVIDSNGAWTEITDADFTGINKLSGFCALDGYLFIADSQNRIYNSDLNQPLVWQATSFISVTDFPGSIKWLMKVRNYLVAFKDNSIEFFEDVGNPTPGSPLESRKQLNRSIGALNRNSIQEVADGVIFAGKTKTGGNKLYKLHKDTLQIKEISTRYIEQCLNTVVGTSTYLPDQNAYQGLAAQAQSFSIGGKDFYAISLYEPLPLPVTNTIQVYDNDLNIWTTWASSTGASGVYDTYGWSGGNCVMYYRAVTNNLVALFANNTLTTTRLVAMDMQVPGWYDVGGSGEQNAYMFAWTSDIYDFGNRRRKFMDSFEVLYDVDSSTTVGTNLLMTLKYRDIDYISGTGFLATRSIPISTSGLVRGISTQLGSFRRRVFTLQYLATTAMRIWGIEVSMNDGETDQEG